jgi:hypothetical protein
VCTVLGFEPEDALEECGWDSAMLLRVIPNQACVTHHHASRVPDLSPVVATVHCVAPL